MALDGGDESVVGGLGLFFEEMRFLWGEGGDRREAWL